MQENIILLSLFILSTALYFPLNRRKSKYCWESCFDRRIPLIPLFIIPYAAYHIYLVLSIIILIQEDIFRGFMIAMISGNILDVCFWYLFPNGVKRPKIVPKNAIERILRFTYNIDMDTNGFPSAHIFHTAAVSFFMWIAFPGLWPLFLCMGLLIFMSVLFTKQHYLVDVFGGILVFFMSLFFAAMLV